MVAPPRLVRALAVATVLGSVACSSEVRRGIGASCESDRACESGVCGAGTCLDATTDDDGDGLLDGLEARLGSSPVLVDSDLDGIRDIDELDAHLALLDTDGDGRADLVESAIADADGDCITDQFDADDARPSADPSPMLVAVCGTAGVCADQRAQLRVTCATGQAACDYGAVVGYANPEVTCDGVDENCDGRADEGSSDGDTDGVADCVDVDRDNDTVSDANDDCPTVANTDQHDADADSRRAGWWARGGARHSTSPRHPWSTPSRPTRRSSAIRFRRRPPRYGTVEVPPGETGFEVASELALVDSVPTALHATATDGAGNTSACSASLTYTYDATAPGAPANLATAPVSPSRASTTPSVSGSAEAGAHVQLFAGAIGCVADACCEMQSSLAPGEVDAAGVFAVVTPVTANALTYLHAQARDAAGNVSPCSAGREFRHDDVAPAPPSMLATAPTSPSSTDATPELSGATEESGVRVSLYGTSDCSGDVLGEVVAEGTVFHLAPSRGAPDSVPVTYAATATDDAGNRSSCSPTSVTYRNDTVSCWGGNGFGQLGIGVLCSGPTPRRVIGVTVARGVDDVDGGGTLLLRDRERRRVVLGEQHQRSARGRHGALPRDAGHGRRARRRGFGAEDLGRRRARLRRHDPIESTPASCAVLSNVQALTAGPSQTCATLADACGTVTCWGNSDGSQLARYPTTPTARPVPGFQGLSDMSCGSAMCVGVEGPDGHLRGHGSYYWKSAFGPGNYSNAGAAFIGSFAGVVRVASSSETSCVTKGDGSLWCFGDFGSGQCGDGTFGNPVLRQEALLP